MLTAAAILTPLIVSFGFWLKSQRKQLVIRKIEPGGKLGPEIYIEKTKLDELKEFASNLFVYGGLGVLLGMAIGMGIGNV